MPSKDELPLSPTTKGPTVDPPPTILHEKSPYSWKQDSAPFNLSCGCSPETPGGLIAKPVTFDSAIVVREGPALALPLHFHARAYNARTSRLLKIDSDFDPSGVAPHFMLIADDSSSVSQERNTKGDHFLVRCIVSCTACFAASKDGAAECESEGCNERYTRAKDFRESRDRIMSIKFGGGAALELPLAHLILMLELYSSLENSALIGGGETRESNPEASTNVLPVSVPWERILDFEREPWAKALLRIFSPDNRLTYQDVARLASGAASVGRLTIVKIEALWVKHSGSKDNGRALWAALYRKYGSAVVTPFFARLPKIEVIPQFLGTAAHAAFISTADASNDAQQSKSNSFITSSKTEFSVKVHEARLRVIDGDEKKRYALDKRLWAAVDKGDVQRARAALLAGAGVNIGRYPVKETLSVGVRSRAGFIECDIDLDNDLTSVEGHHNDCDIGRGVVMPDEMTVFISILIRAAQRGDVDMIKLLVDAGADPSEASPAAIYADGDTYGGITPLMCARKSLAATEVLVTLGAEVRAAKSIGLPAYNDSPYPLHTTLMMAANDEVARFLVCHGANINDAAFATTAYNGKFEALHAYWPSVVQDVSFSSTRLSWIKELLNVHGADPNWPQSLAGKKGEDLGLSFETNFCGLGATVLIIAIIARDADVVDLLLSSGADPNLQEFALLASELTRDDEKARSYDVKNFYISAVERATPLSVALGCLRQEKNSLPTISDEGMPARMRKMALDSTKVGNYSATENEIASDRIVRSLVAAGAKADARNAISPLIMPTFRAPPSTLNILPLGSPTDTNGDSSLQSSRLKKRARDQSIS